MILYEGFGMSDKPQILPLSAQLGMELVATAKILRRMLSREAAALGLHEGEWGILVHIHRSGEGMSQKELARLLGHSPHAVVRVLSNMEASGLVERQIDPEDARGRKIVLREKGRALAEALIARVAARETEMVSGYSDATLLPVVQLLRQIQARLEASTP